MGKELFNIINDMMDVLDTQQLKNLASRRDNNPALYALVNQENVKLAHRKYLG